MRVAEGGAGGMRLLEGGVRACPNQWEFFVVGAWLSLVERFVRDEEVAGSNPVAPIFSPQALGASAYAPRKRVLHYSNCSPDLVPPQAAYFAPQNKSAAITTTITSESNTCS